MFKSKLMAFLFVLALILAACRPAAPVEPIPTSSPAEPTLAAASETPAPSPTPTSLPAAALVNGEIIPLSYYQNEVLRYRASFAEGETPPTDTEIQTTVLNSLIEQLLLAQQARQSGFTFTDADVQQRIDALLTQLGSGSALTDWMQVNHYDDAEFRYALKLSTEAAWQRCYLHFLRNALDYLPRKADDDCLQELRWLYDRRDIQEAQRDLSAWIGKWQAKYPKLVDWVEANIIETLTFYRLPRAHHKHLKSTNMLERLNEEIKRRTLVVRIFPNTESCLRLIRALCIETHETWLEDNRYLNMTFLAEQKKELLRLAA